MKIIDKENLIPNESALREIIEKHPLRKNIDYCIRNLIIVQSECCYIELDKDKDVKLCLVEDVSLKINYKYILFHEFSHIFDKLNPEFKYTDGKRDALTEIEKHVVMEIWNTYIDSRLNRFYLFKIEDEGKEIQCRIGNDFQKLPNNIETKLKLSIDFLQKRSIKNAKDIIENIWKYPAKFLSYDDIINKSKPNKYVV